MGLYLPTFSPFLIVNKASLSPLRQLPIAGEYLHVYVCNFLHGFVLSTKPARQVRGLIDSHIRVCPCLLPDQIDQLAG